MAASKTLDPSQTTTAAEAFKYPLPQVRQFHRTLTVSLDEKNARLRTLVGGSYRQLLGTAETILEMRKDIEVVEEKLGRVGEGCGMGKVGEKVKGLGKLGDGRGERSGLEWTAMGKCLGMCAVEVGRLLRRKDEEGKGKSLVIAAKVLVLSRLLAKSLGSLASKRGKEERESVEESKRKLGSLRRRLLKSVDRILERKSGKDDREDIALALAAYSLATSSGAKDVLTHFLRVRGEAIALCFEESEESKKDFDGVVKALELYTRSLLDVQALVPRRLAETLSGLKSKALLKDDSIRELEGLRLDVTERWFGDEILYFTPYIRHDDLEGSQAVDILKGWAKKASEVLLQGLSKTLERTTDFKMVVELRTNILGIWIKDGGKAKGFDPSVLLGGLRKVINNRLVELLESRVGKLHLVGTEIEATLGSWRAGITDKYESLWDDTMLNMEIINGASLFKQGILARTFGRNDAVSRVHSSYQTWRHLVDEIITFIGQLKKQRWDDDLEDLEDDISVESRNTLLSQDDPKMLQDHLDKSLEKTYQELHQKIGSLLQTHKDSEEIGKISTYALRVIRDIRIEIPQNPALQSFGLTLVPSLHEQLASSVAESSVESFSKTFKRKRVAGRVLWEGSPELPVQPSPGTFKFLHGLSLAMASAGGDLWSTTAVSALKKHVRRELGTRWAPEVDSLGTPPEKVEETEKEDADVDAKVEKVGPVDSETTRELFIQSLFDVLVLQNALDLALEKEDELEALGKSLEAKIELEASSKKKLQRGATEYWKKTSLLFGLLS